MKKIIIPFLVFILFGSATFVFGQMNTTGQETGQGQQVQTEQETQNRGEEQQIRTREEMQIQEEGQTEEELSELLIMESPQKARTMNELRKMVQQKKQEMEEALGEMSAVEQKVYRNQNTVREAVHALLSMEDLATGIGPQVSQIAREFNNSVQATIMAEEKIQKRSAFVRFFMGGEKDAAGEIERKINQNQQRIEELNRLRKECACGEEVKTMIQEQIQNMEQEQERLQQLAKKENNRNGLFGWIRNLFSWGR